MPTPTLTSASHTSLSNASETSRTLQVPSKSHSLKVTTQTTHSDTNAWGLTALSPPTRQITNIALAQCYPTHRSGLIHQPPRLRIPSCHP
ncbi:hypothetical protein [Rubritalea tangerina]|uniref:hypothetical protein n=1 Tax=Rubritalea tangerina TaxID=430798 RepID=UPI00361A2117